MVITRVKVFMGTNLQNLAMPQHGRAFTGLYIIITICYFQEQFPKMSEKRGEIFQEKLERMFAFGEDLW